MNEDKPWYIEHGILSIGLECGGPDDNGISREKIRLYKIVKREMSSTYCQEIKHFAIAILVAGKFANWGEDKIERIRRDHKYSYIGCDIVVGFDSLNRPYRE